MTLPAPITDPRFAALVARGQAKAATAAPVAGVVLDPAGGLSGAHRAVLGALDELLGLLGGQAGALPAPARMMLATVTASRGMMVDALARMPEAQLRGVLSVLRGRIDAALTPDA